MKRNKPLVSKTPMKRSPFKTADRATTLRRSAMKARVKKPTVEEGSKYLAACRDEPCYLRVFGVCVGRESVVPCHSNQLRHGKGKGIKAKHEFTVPGCWACHAWIDQGKAAREVKFSTWDRGYERWVPVRAEKMGLKEEEGAVLDSNSGGDGVALAPRPQREAVCDGAVPADADARNDGVSAGAAEDSEQRQAVCLG
ncbi:gp74 [Caballeronia cordobensis]|uniref:Gp74 n=1 Tax=Caballeronia cordobensis TaxID=1353886 RepID=A0A158FKL6_CABCO|nr:gp74 [Caballeronia cordobensis]